MRHRKVGIRRLSGVALSALVLLGIAAAPAAASHSWADYHWARTSNPFALNLVDSVTSDWDPRLGLASGDWSQSNVLDTTTPQGDTSSKTRKRCPAPSGKARVCNAYYGFNGWLGLAQVWVSGSHITQGTAKMNDSYLSSSSYSETNRQHVMCQEVGHDFGLGHQDESGADLDTCMDYSNALDNAHPNAHDYEQLEAIYNSHTDSSSTVSAMPASSGKGKLRRLHDDLYVEDLGKGRKRFVWVVWKDDRLPHAPPVVE